MQGDCNSQNRGKFPTAIIAVAVAVIAIIIVIALILFASNPYSGYGGYGGYYGGMMGGFGGYWMLFMIPIGLIILVIIGYVVWRAVNWGNSCCGTGQYGHYEDRGNAMEILRQRYARGEISKEQYEQMKKDIVS
jgi:putative membrane protein